MPPTAQQIEARDDWAIVAGISRYPDLGDVQGPENDAIAFHQWLTSPDGGGLPADDKHVRLILSSAFEPVSPSAVDAQPDEGAIRRAFEVLDDLSNLRVDAGHGPRVGRRLYIFLAGHGFAPQIDESALLTANARARRVLHHIPGKLYANHFRSQGYFDEVILFMECCREVSDKVPVSVPPWISFNNPEAVGTMWLHGLATGWARLARAKPIGPNGEMRGVFTTTLLKGLGGEAADASLNAITASSLKDYVETNVRRLLNPAEIAEELSSRPEINQSQGKADPPFVIKRIEPPQFPVRITFDKAKVGDAVRIKNSSFEVVRETEVAGASWDLTLPRGLYEARSPHVEVRFEVDSGVHDVQL